jgi:microcystin-dependent protein
MPGAFNYGMIPANSPKGSAFQSIQPAVLPAGVIEMFAGSTAPSGWLICDGSTVSRRIYSDLFKVIGTTYGAGDGNTTFTLPDMRGRVPMGVGQGAGLTNRTLASTTGSESVTLSSSNIPSLTTGNQSANHTHSGTSSGVSVNHYHQNYSDGVGSGTMGRGQYGFSGLGGGYAGVLIVGSGQNNYSTSYTGYISSDHTHTLTTGNESANHTHTYTNASPTAVSTFQPSISLNFIIKV